MSKAPIKKPSSGVLAILAGVGWILSATVVFGVRHAVLDVVAVFSGATAVGLFLAGLFFMVWSMARARVAAELVQTAYILMTCGLIALGMLYLALLQDPSNFMATLTSTLAGVAAGWLISERNKIFGKPSSTPDKIKRRETK